MFQLDESKKKIQNTKESKHKKSKQTNKQTGFVTKENDQTAVLEVCQHDSQRSWCAKRRQK